MSDFEQRFGGIARLYGRVALERLHCAHVAVVGIGGVGSWSVEALARSGVGRLTLIDLDDICVTNTNRQIHATTKNIGQLKAQAMADRAKEINPEIQVEVVPEFLTSANSDKLLSRDFDCVLDAIDNVANKCLLIAECCKRKLPIVTTGGAGGRRDLTQIRTGDLNKVTHDALLRQVRKRLRREHSIGETGELALGIRCVFSTEPVKFPWSDGSVCEEKEPSGESLRLDCNSGYGTATFLTGAFGFAAAAEVVGLIVASN
jgi:tRNA A37 threonylcarbamoyladenosine dehydratase